ncbi:ABC transporter permease [Alkalibacterium olivapovliticus]|uniref:ABC-2 type transport system permease protein n=1 Tax=Alkalibacterium olivapovliticus TaxID=99907 RepID=A0A2T0W7M2_9LACT|nr:ABC transporter permease [Alkalibacterium olivapovliticus]PRY82524.1 ABC-2 type transport system permease protein [Alkalibacterium olivapovliticus]
MWTVFKMQWLRLFKQPVLMIMFLGLTLVFVYFMGGAQGAQNITVPTYSDELSSEELDRWIDRLNEEDTFQFVESDYETVFDDIRMNETAFALGLTENNYEFLIGREDMEIATLIQYVDQIFTTEMRLQDVEDRFDLEDITIRNFIEVETVSRSAAVSSGDRSQLGVVVGMSLYFSIFSILFLMINLVEEKESGTWNRLIFSPLTKTRIYMGQLSHYLLAGTFQIALAFFILRYLVGIEMGTNYLEMGVIIISFVFAIVSLGMLLMGLIKSPQQLQVVIPIVTTSMAMLGGAFWPLEVVSNRLLLFIGNLMPIKYGIDAMTDTILHDQTLSQLLTPISVLLLMGIVFMGIGINLIERVSEN